MKENCQIKLEKIIDNLNGVPKLLLHSCCAPCSSYCIEYLSKYFSITIFYYNPNIDSIDEYNKRKNEQKRFINEYNAINEISFVDIDYDNSEYYNAIKGFENLAEGSMRCYKCYEMRLKQAAMYAKKNHFDYFGTTLSVSPHKNSAWINEIGKNLETENEIKFLYADFKKKDGYKRSIELSKKYNLYRQDYCGCIFSLNRK